MLTDEQIEAAAIRDKPYKLADAKGVYVYITRAGTKSLRWKYRFRHREKVLTLGQHPAVPIQEARLRAGRAREVLRQGQDPMDPMPAMRGAPAFSLADLAKMEPPLNPRSRVYFAQIASGHIKIGVTTAVEQRMRTFQLTHAEPVVLLATMPGGHAHEQLLHKVFAADRDMGEWFSPSENLRQFVATLAPPACL